MWAFSHLATATEVLAQLQQQNFKQDYIPGDQLEQLRLRPSMVGDHTVLGGSKVAVIEVISRLTMGISYE